MKQGDRVRVVKLRPEKAADDENNNWFLEKEGVLVRQARTEGAWIVCLDLRCGPPHDFFFEDELKVL